jgi:hypothetical protein
MAVLANLTAKQNNMQAAGELLNRASAGGNISPDTAYFIARYLSANGDPAQALQVLKPAIDFKGLFLYRQPANRLFKELSASAPSDAASGTTSESKK